MSQASPPSREYQAVDLMLKVGTPLIVGAILAGAGALWTMSNRVTSLSVQIGAIPASLQAVQDRGDARAAQMAAEARLREAELRVSISDFGSGQAALDARISRVEASLDRAWPRLRAHTAADELLRNELVEVCREQARRSSATGGQSRDCDFTLPEPQGM